MSHKRCYTTEELANIIIEDIPFGKTSDIDTSDSEYEDIPFTADRLQAERKDQT